MCVCVGGGGGGWGGHSQNEKGTKTVMCIDHIQIVVYFAFI